MYRIGFTWIVCKNRRVTDVCKGIGICGDVMGKFVKFFSCLPWVAAVIFPQIRLAFVIII